MSSKPAPTYYVFHGKDSFTRGHEVRLMKARMGKGTEASLNIRAFSAGAVRIAEALQDVTTYPFLSDKRLVIVNDILTDLAKRAASKDSKADLEMIVNALPTLPEYSRLLFVESDELPASHPVLKLMQTDTHGYEKLFAVPKNMAEWIARRAVGYDAQIEPRAAARLAEMLGPDLFTTDNEVAKLAAYVNGERPIRESDIELLTVNQVESRIYELTDLIGHRRGKQAAALTHKLLDEGNEPLMLLGSIYGQYRKLMIVKVFEAEGINGNLAELLNVSSKAAPYAIPKLREQAAKYTLVELESIHRILLDTDFKVKSGGFGPANGGVLALDLLIATIAG